MYARNKAKINIPMCLAAVLFCLTLFSIHLTGGLYAKYTTSGAGSDSARVITFGELTLTETGSYTEVTNGKEFIITPGVPIEKQATVSFGGSESATYVFVKVDAADWTEENNTFTYTFADDKTMSWSVTDGWSPLGGHSGVYYMSLGPNTELDEVKVITDILDGEGNVIGNIEVPSTITKADLSKIEEALSIKFQASVVQSGGFESAEAAWASLSGKGA